MVSYSSSSYTNDFFDLSGFYFNSTSQSSSSIDIDELDKRYLQKTGCSVSSNLIINGSLDVKTNITLPDIGDVEDAIQRKTRHDIRWRFNHSKNKWITDGIR